MQLVGVMTYMNWCVVVVHADPGGGCCFAEADSCKSSVVHMNMLVLRMLVQRHYLVAYRKHKKAKRRTCISAVL